MGAKVEGPAYLKLMLHAAKYPWAAVSGFLLGDADTAASSQVKQPPVGHRALILLCRRRRFFVFFSADYNTILIVGTIGRVGGGSWPTFLEGAVETRRRRKPLPAW